MKACMIVWFLLAIVAFWVVSMFPGSSSACIAWACRSYKNIVCFCSVNAKCRQRSVDTVVCITMNLMFVCLFVCSPLHSRLDLSILARCLSTSIATCRDVLSTSLAHSYEPSQQTSCAMATCAGRFASSGNRFVSGSELESTGDKRDLLLSHLLAS